MSDEAARPDASAALGIATQEIVRSGTGWLMTLQRETVLVLGMLALTLTAAWYVAGTAIPDALNIINAGHAARDEAHSKDLDKVIASFKENSDRHEKHVKEILDIMREDRRPIAVNPLGGGS